MYVGPNTEEAITVACIMDCAIITVHNGKCYKALIDFGAAISLIQCSTYQHIDNSFKTPIQPTTAKLNTANGPPMTALGKTALHLRIADFKFTHNFIICNRLPDTEIIFRIDVQQKCPISYAWDREKNCYIQIDGRFNWHISLKIPPRHNGVVRIKITGQAVKDHMAYFITDENQTKGRDSNVNIINSIHSIKGKPSVNVF